MRSMVEGDFDNASHLRRSPSTSLRLVPLPVPGRIEGVTPPALPPISTP
jgi:hypothetical protein